MDDPAHKPRDVDDEPLDDLEPDEADDAVVKGGGGSSQSNETGSDPED